MELMETFASNAAQSLLSESQTEVVIANEKIVVHLVSIKAPVTNYSDQHISVTVNSTTNTLNFPASILQGKEVTVSAVVFNDLHTTTPSSLEGSSNDTTTTFGSKVMSIQLTALDGSNVTFSPSDPVEIVLGRNEDANTTNTESLCVYWKFLSSEEAGGVWSTEGCSVNGSDGSQVTCLCDHLTNFAVLLSVNPNPIVLTKGHRIALDMLTYVGLALSVAALVCTLATFIWFKLLKSQRNIIHANLAVAMVTAQFLYLVGIEQTRRQGACKTIAFLLHYLFTATFAWMLMEGIYILMQTRTAYGKGVKTWMYLIIGWGFPLVIVSISFGIRFNGYGTENHCWLSATDGLMWAFAIPVLIVIAINTVVLIMVIRVFMSLKANADKTEVERFRAGARAILMLQPLLGFTWIFGLLSSYDTSLFFTYMFVIFNSLQGVFIFILHCVMNEEVKKAFRSKYRRHARRRSTLASTTETSVALRTTRAFVDKVPVKRDSKVSKRSSLGDEIAMKLSKGSTKVEPLNLSKVAFEET
ncbi:adhesion G-protein coupled receptor D1-like [Diadema antillarum]|uniref:adhesion G-protein coupled receptor D1-like n=1 Tax=Diadema antillarum TaxID=105358 RepID=UPI003A843B06